MSERPDTEPEPMDIGAMPVIAAVGAVVTLVGLAAVMFRLVYGDGISSSPPAPRPFPEPQLVTMPSASGAEPRAAPAAIEGAMAAIAARGAAAYDPVTEDKP